MKLFYYCNILLLIILSTRGMVSAQGKNTVEMPIKLSIPAISLIDFAGSDSRITFTMGNGAEQIITPSTLNKTWINYSSIVNGNSTNTISVNLSSGNLPAEIGIKLDVGEDAKAGAGTTGKPIGKITLTPYPQEIITGIGSCFTGKGTQKGHHLIYSWDWLPPYDLDHSSVDNIEVSVTYTLTSTK